MTEPKPVHKCLVPTCTRKDVSSGAYLCPGHAVLFQRQSNRTELPRLEDIREWVATLGQPQMKNGASHG